MGETKTSEEILEQRKEVLGDEFGLLYHTIYGQFLWIISKWIEYQELYTTKETRIQLLNDTAPSFFGMIQELFWENILLGICRLTDPERSTGKRNASINTLNNYVRDKRFKATLVEKTIELSEKSEFSRDWRNRRISHSDFGLLVDKNAKPLPKATQNKVSGFISAFLEYINMFEKHYFDSEVAFGTFSARHSARSLLHVLDEGLEAKNKRIKRLKSGIMDDSDFNRRDI